MRTLAVKSACDIAGNDKNRAQNYSKRTRSIGGRIIDSRKNVPLPAQPSKTANFHQKASLTIVTASPLCQPMVGQEN
jgi:hypothetical protein